MEAYLFVNLNIAIFDGKKFLERLHFFAILGYFFPETFDLLLTYRRDRGSNVTVYEIEEVKDRRLWLPV